jgi:hypothetical protein
VLLAEVIDGAPHAAGFGSRVLLDVLRVDEAAQGRGDASWVLVDRRLHI